MSVSSGYILFGVTRAQMAEIDDDMRAIRRQYRVARNTGAVTHRETGRLIGWAGRGRQAYSCKYEDGRDLCDEFSVTHAVVSLHKDSTEPVRRGEVTK